MTAAWFAAACRTAVAPRGGAFATIEAPALASHVLKALLTQTELPRGLRLEVVFGNALYGGGNPARIAALQAGLPETVPALTLDTQCCSGLDAMAYGASRIASGQADAVIAGGLESYSRAPLRYRRPLEPGGSPTFYARPPFTPWPDRDPDLIVAAAALAAARGITRRSQEEFAIESHRKARETLLHESEIVHVNDVRQDTFARNLTASTCARLPPLTGTAPNEMTVATIAVEADAAAAALLVSETVLKRLEMCFAPVRLVGTCSRGFDPVQPALASIAAATELLRQENDKAANLRVGEVMEAFAVQAMVAIEDLNVDPAIVNRGGGALARGHPIGASGAILAVRLFHELQKERSGAKGLATIAAAGGLGSAMLLQR